MSGLIGAYFRKKSRWLPISKLKSACSIMKIGNSDNESSFESDDLFSLCTVSSNNVNACDVYEDNFYYIAFLGNLYNAKELLKGNQDDEIDDTSSTARLIAKLYNKFNQSIVEHLNGIFLCVIWQKFNEKLILLSDRYGYEHLYYFHNDEAFLFSTSIFSLLKIMNMKISLDKESIADLFNFNMIFRDRSICSGIQLCEPAMLYEISNNKASLLTYWTYDNSEPYLEQDIIHLRNEAKTHIRKAVKSSTNGFKNIGCLISGGLDSRLLLASLSELGAVNSAYSYQHKDIYSNDHKIAQLVAEHLNIPFNLISPNSAEKLEDELYRDLFLTDGQFVFLGIDPIIKISDMSRGIALVTGFLLDTLFKSGWMIFKKRDNCNILTENHLLKRYVTSGNYIFDRFLLPDFAIFLKERKLKRIRQEIEYQNENEPENSSFAIYCRNRGRRFHSTVSKACRYYVDIIQPGTHYDLFDFGARLPYALKSDSHFYRKLISEWFPGIAKIPWEKTGKPIEDGDKPSHNNYLKYKNRAQFYLQRATHGWFDQQNPIESFNKKFRRDKIFRGAVIDILSDKQSIDCQYYDMKGLDRLIKEQREGRDYAPFFYSLLRLAILGNMIAEYKF